MSNRRKKSSFANSRQSRKAPEQTAALGLPNEGLCIILGCIGLLTVLSLTSYSAVDTSLNTSGSTQVHNWIGPAGAYWADLLLQIFGVGAYAFGLGLILASWRSFGSKRILPGTRETLGLFLLVPTSGTFAHLLFLDKAETFPAGGLIGNLIGQYLLHQFAGIGAAIISGGLLLLALAITTDGILSGMGIHSTQILKRIGIIIKGFGHLLKERQRHLLEYRAEMAAKRSANVDDWLEKNKSAVEIEENFSERTMNRAQDMARDMAEKSASREKLRKERQTQKKLDQLEKMLQRKEDKASLDEPVAETPSKPAIITQDLPLETSTPSAAPKETHPPAAEPKKLEKPVQHTLPIEDKAAAQTPPPLQQDEPQEPAEIPEPTNFDPATIFAPVTESKKKSKDNHQPQIVDVVSDIDQDAIETAAKEKISIEAKDYELPPATLLDFSAVERYNIDPEILQINAEKLTKALKNYGIQGQVREIRPGPVVTMYEFVPSAGIKVSKIAGLADDLAMTMEAMRVRIVAPIPGKGAVGIEIPNESRESVFIKEIITHKKFRSSGASLPLALGKDIEGNAYSADLTQMPHLLVAGATGAGKSVSINSMIMSILYNSSPEDVRMLMVDPKMLELSVYDGIPHLLLPVVTDPKKASIALRWAVREMEQRYEILSAAGVRNIASYNKKVKDAQDAGRSLVIDPKKPEDAPRRCEKMPYIVIIVDELADLMMVASREVESSIMRLAQMARAAGIHLILATQRPSVDVLTGVIKANFPTRIAFQVASKHDSRTIIDTNGAEHLLGCGDMLYLSPGAGGITRVHGAFVSDEEIEKTVQFIKSQGSPQYNEEILTIAEEESQSGESDEDRDEMYDQALNIVLETQQASISMIQRRLRIGYNRAARMVETLEREGVVGPADGAKPRTVLIQPSV
jgi:S-DNA-T family DNA segregation ATPase FtsK/SpoIIIE